MKKRDKKLSDAVLAIFTLIVCLGIIALPILNDFYKRRDNFEEVDWEAIEAKSLEDAEKRGKEDIRKILEYGARTRQVPPAYVPLRQEVDEPDWDLEGHADFAEMWERLNKDNEGG